MPGYGFLITEAREAAGLTKADLADRINVDASIVGRIEREEIGITPAVFQRLTTALRGVSPVALLNAMGYPVTVPGADRLPRPLVQELLTLSPREVEALVILLRGVTAPAHPREELPQ